MPHLFASCDCPFVECSNDEVTAEEELWSHIRAKSLAHLNIKFILRERNLNPNPSTYT